jgi:hypothetical protein
VAVGGTGVTVGNWGVGVLGGAKDPQAEIPKARIKIKARLRKSFLIREFLLEVWDL